MNFRKFLFFVVNNNAKFEMHPAETQKLKTMEKGRLVQKITAQHTSSLSHIQIQIMIKMSSYSPSLHIKISNSVSKNLTLLYV